MLYFGDRDALRDASRIAELQAAFPGAHVIGCSGIATILGRSLFMQDIVATAIRFEHTRIGVARRAGVTVENSRAVGAALAQDLAGPELAGVLVLADGMRTEGVGLTNGLRDVLGTTCPILGGMSSDPAEYAVTLVGVDGPPESGVVGAIGFYGPRIRLSHGCASGWDAFGPRRRITRAAANVLHELDGRPAWELYERYLGDEVSTGVAAGVVYPLQVSHPNTPEQGFVRAVLGVDAASGAMTFAGYVPEGWMARLMRGTLDRLVFAAGDAAQQARAGMPEQALGDRLALLITCAGRYLQMGQRTIEEIELAEQNLWPGCHCLGFYTFGEIAPVSPGGAADLHNQTMVIAALSEVAE